MDRRTACLALGSLPTLSTQAQAQRIRRIAWTSVNSANPPSPFLDSFRTSLRTLGWAEGSNLAIDTWWGEGSVEGLKKLVPAILADRPDLIVSAGGPATRVMIDSNVRVPIAFTGQCGRSGRQVRRELDSAGRQPHRDLIFLVGASAQTNTTDT